MYSLGNRSLVTIILLLLGIPVFYWVVSDATAYVSGTTLFDGDVAETRQCRECGGGGKDESLAEEFPGTGDRCPACNGRGEVTVILPGPVRPTRIWGAVVDTTKAGDVFLYSRPANIRMVSVQAALLPAEVRDIPGALPGARIEFKPETGEPITLKADFSGRFNQRIHPGRYDVTVKAPGLEVYRGQIEVERLKEPIWFEKATIVRELSWGEAQGAYGLALVVGMIPKGQRKGAFVRLYPASP